LNIQINSDVKNTEKQEKKNNWKKKEKNQNTTDNDILQKKGNGKISICKFILSLIIFFSTKLSYYYFLFPSNIIGDNSWAIEFDDPNDVSSIFQESVTEFEKCCNAYTHLFCSICKKVSMTTEMHKKKNTDQYVCNICTKSKRTIAQMNQVLPIWKEKNGTIRYDLPEQLQDLSEAEKLLISPYLVYVPLHHMAKGQIGCRGHVCCFQQDIPSISNVLPRLPQDISLIRIIKQYKDDNGEISSKIFTVRRSKVIEALYWLKEYSIVFQDININIDNLSWMENKEEKQLPAIEENTILDDIPDLNAHDRGPSISQIDDVIENENDYNEITGTQISNTTGTKMDADNIEINNKISQAYQKR
jgi:hypothetical protein